MAAIVEERDANKLKVQELEASLLKEKQAATVEVQMPPEDLIASPSTKKHDDKAWTKTAIKAATTGSSKGWYAIAACTHLGLVLVLHWYYRIFLFPRAPCFPVYRLI